MGCEDPAPTTLLCTPPAALHVHTHAHIYPHARPGAACGRWCAPATDSHQPPWCPASPPLLPLRHRLQSPGTFQAQLEAPGSKFGVGNPDSISSARTRMPLSSLLACSHVQEGTASIPSPFDALISGWWAVYSRETFWAPKPGDSQELRRKSLPKRLLSPNNLFPQDFPHPCPQQPAAVLLTVSLCPGDAGSLWMLPWKGPQEKPSGRLLRVRTRLSPSCTARSSSSVGTRAQHQRDATQPEPWPAAAPGPQGHGHPTRS